MPKAGQTLGVFPPPPEAVKWLRAGNKLEAIKAYPQLTRLGLKDAKGAVEALEKRLGAR